MFKLKYRMYRLNSKKSLVAPGVRNLPCNAEDMGLIHCPEDLTDARQLSPYAASIICALEFSS